MFVSGGCGVRKQSRALRQTNRAAARRFVSDLRAESVNAVMTRAVCRTAGCRPPSRTAIKQDNQSASCLKLSPSKRQLAMSLPIRDAAVGCIERHQFCLLNCKPCTSHLR